MRGPGSPAVRAALALPAAVGVAMLLLPATRAGGVAARRLLIGHSRDGRALVARVKGDPEAATRVLVVGCIHGDEPAGTRVTRRLSAGPGPRRSAALWVLPTLNPDGLAAGTRGNADGVDLNRNFPFRWRPLGGGEYSGREPLSEPESRAAWRLIRRLRPNITIWFHQPFDLVDRSGGDLAIERRYARLSGLPLVGLRRYPGSATGWQNHAFHRSTAFVVELPAVVSTGLARRAARAVLTLVNERASADVGPARDTGA
jgi:protein MpaA